jgi:phosphoglycerate dehydrogenase-like enzyme
VTGPIVTLVGPGVEARAALLRRSGLDPDWQVVLASSGAASAAVAIAAIGMPDAVAWQPTFPALRFLQLPGAGLDGLRWSTVPSGCTVANVYEHESSVAEYVFTTLLSRKSGEWRYFDRIGGPPRSSLCSSRIGIVGFGHIGRRCAQLASGFGMQVRICRTGLSGDSTDAPDEFTVVAGAADLAGQVDILVVACRLTEQTRGLIGRTVLERLGPHAVLVNAARAEIVDESALFDVLSNRRIGGAILDVWYRYPQAADQRMAGSRFDFTALPNVIATPHLAANTEHMVRARWQFMADNLNRFLRDRPVLNAVPRPAAEMACSGSVR